MAVDEIDMSHLRIYQVDTGEARGGVVVRDGVVTEAAPVHRWMVGKRWCDVGQWRRIKTVVEIRKRFAR